MKLGRRLNYHKGRAAIRHYADLREPSDSLRFKLAAAGQGGEGGAGAGLHTAGGHAQTPPRPRHPGTVPPLPPVTRYCEDDIQRPVFTTTDCAGAHLAHYDSTTLGSCWAEKGSCVVRHSTGVTVTPPIAGKSEQGSQGTLLHHDTLL